MSDYTIILSDGTEVKAHLNMNTWESVAEPDDALFENNTNEVSYITPEGDTIELGECKYRKGIHFNGAWTFFLVPLTEEEKRIKMLNQQIADVEDALCELAEMLSE